jgi:hypothetical protein
VVLELAAFNTSVIQVPIPLLLGVYLGESYQGLGSLQYWLILR